MFDITLGDPTGSRLDKDFVTLTPTDCDNDDQNFRISDVINKAIPHAS